MNAVAFKPAIEPVKPSGPFDKSSGSTSSTSASSTGPRRERISAVVRSLPPSGIRRFFDLVAEMKGVVSLGVGEPDFVTPQHVRDMAMYSLEQGYTSYTSNFGLLELREAISDYLRHFIGNVYDPRKEILVTVGVSEAVDLALRAILEPGDEVIIPEPCYVSYKPCTVLAGGVPVVVSTTVQNGFQLTARDLESHITGRTKAILLCYPNNPTGATLSYENMEGIASIAVKHDLLVISDEIYGELTYSGTHVSIASFPDMQERTIVLNGFSKAHAMTGWRIGYAAGPSDIIAAMVKIHQYVALCAPITAQKAAYEALLHG
ncbi:MAG TPA: aminotransferase class I/II-fold pyridoxal phosphate-dependent enzyme, partial [Firmicutes bacterium]|nr:aminotransferase class I/II-fold pyridoxal phosphate-dependent enzyme [Bacillota bacterium]